MKISILTLFPEMFSALDESIIGRAKKAGKVEIEAVNIRDYSKDKHKKCDDAPFGGGAGMLMQAGPVYGAYEHVLEKAKTKPRVIYLSPQGQTFSQSMAEEFAKEEELVFLCGHYEGVDRRIIDEIVDEEISIGDYVLTGGELPALILADSVSRMLPGVLAEDIANIPRTVRELADFEQVILVNIANADMPEGGIFFSVIDIHAHPCRALEIHAVKHELAVAVHKGFHEKFAAFFCRFVHFKNLFCIYTCRFFADNIKTCLKGFYNKLWMVVMRNCNDCRID